MRPQICALSSDLSFEVFFTLLRHAAGPAYGCSYDSQRVLTCRAAWDPDAYMPMPNHKSPQVPDNLQRLISSLQHEKQSSGIFRPWHVPHHKVTESMCRCGRWHQSLRLTLMGEKMDVYPHWHMQNHCSRYFKCLRQAECLPASPLSEQIHCPLCPGVWLATQRHAGASRQGILRAWRLRRG